MGSALGKRLLITGGAGFIGSHACEALLQRGVRVLGIDNFSNFYARSWKEQNLKALSKPIELFEMDITDAVSVERVIGAAKPSAIIHLAAMVAAEVSGFGWESMILQGWITFDSGLAGYGFSLATVYAVWLSIVIVLYFLCRWYDRYKRANAGKWWLSYL